MSQKQECFALGITLKSHGNPQHKLTAHIIIEQITVMDDPDSNPVQGKIKKDIMGHLLL